MSPAPGRKRSPLAPVVHVTNLYTFPPFPLLFIDMKGTLYRQQKRTLHPLRWSKFKGVTRLRLSYEGFVANLTYDWAVNIRDRFGIPVHWDGQVIRPNHVSTPADGA